MTQFSTQVRYCIVGYLTDISLAYRQKLMSLGMLPGAVFEIVRIAPLGDPIEIQVQRTHLVVRRKDLMLLKLEEVAQAVSV